MTSPVVVAPDAVPAGVRTICSPAGCTIVPTVPADDPYGIASAALTASATVEFYSEDQPRGPDGRWGGDGETKTATGSGTKADPIVTNNVAVAAKALGEGKWVRLTDQARVSVLLDKLAYNARHAEEMGRKAPNYDLCRVSVSGTNLFCADSLPGQTRLTMPQFTGAPLPGSIAEREGTPTGRPGRVDMTDQFIAHLQGMGVSVTPHVADAASLRATQNELNGVKVGEMMGAIRDGTYAGDKAIIVSRDNYILDGHHTWAAKVGIEYGSGKPVAMDVRRVDAPIGDLLHYANDYSRQVGLPSKAHGQYAAGTVALHARVTSSTVEFYSEDQPRAANGRFGEGDSSKAPLGSSKPGAQRSQKVQNAITGRANALTGSTGHANPDEVKAAVVHDIAERMSGDVRGRDTVGMIEKGIGMTLGIDVVGAGKDAYGKELDRRMKEGSGWYARVGQTVTGRPGLEWAKVEKGGRPPAGFVPASAPQIDGFIREQAVNSLVATWAVTSNDSDLNALALQEAARQEFGLTGALDWSGKVTAPGDPIGKELARYGDVYRSFLRAQYDSTQAFFASKKITEVPVYRGMMVKARVGETDKLTPRPLSSWSLKRSEAQQFIDYRGGNKTALLAATFPASAVLSTAVTGVGCLDEGEIVTLGVGGKVEVLSNSSLTAAATTIEFYSEDQPRGEDGRWGEGDGSKSQDRETRPGGWSKLTGDEMRAEAAKAYQDRGMSAEKAAERAQRDSDIKERVGRTTEMWVGPHGTRVEFDSKARISDAKKQEALDTVAGLKATYGDRGARSVAFVSEQTAGSLGRMAGGAAYGLTVRGGGHVVMSPSSARPGGQKNFNELVNEGRFQKEGAGRSLTAYAITHEFGHTLDTPRTVERSAATQHALDTISAGSSYGSSDQPGWGGRRTDGSEAYAESFAAWHLSGGTTDDPLARALAKSEGWKVP